MRCPLFIDVENEAVGDVECADRQRGHNKTLCWDRNAAYSVLLWDRLWDCVLLLTDAGDAVQEETTSAQ